MKTVIPLLFLSISVVFGAIHKTFTYKHIDEIRHLISDLDLINVGQDTLANVKVSDNVGGDGQHGRDDHGFHDGYVGIDSNRKLKYVTWFNSNRVNQFPARILVSLDTEENERGYDITAINVFSGWPRGRHSNQSLLIEYKTVDKNEWQRVEIDKYPFDALASTPYQLNRISGDENLVCNVKTLRFTFFNVKGHLLIQEIDVFGKPSTL